MLKFLLHLVPFLSIFSLAAQDVNSFHLTTDTEVGMDGSVTQYILYDYVPKDKVMGFSALALGILAADGSQFGESAAGPNFHGKIHGRKWFLNTYFGPAKGGRFVAVAFGGADLPHQLKLVAASDPKFPVGHLGRAPEIWFSRAWLGRDNAALGLGIYGRHDYLQGAREGKAGLEIRRQIAKRLQLYSFPYRDYRQATWGITLGARLSLL